jgi:hypothetical protein
MCECREEDTMVHFLLEWERYAGARREVRREVRREMGLVELSVRLVFLPQFLFPLLRFIHSSKHFRHFFF